MRMKQEIVTWEYSQDADITFGEMHENPLPKILLAILSISIVILCAAAFILRDYIYDLIENPRVVLTSDVMHENGVYIDIPYKSTFDANRYISDMYTDSDGNPEYELLSIDGEVNTNVLGTYNVVYSSKNRITTNQETLIVNVRDITAPTIQLNAVMDTAGNYNPIILVRGVKDDGTVLGTESFDANNYILSVTDDYCDEDQIRINHTGESIDFGTSGTTTANIIYTATDAYNNSSQVSLSLVIMDDYDAAAAEWEKQVEDMQAQLAALQNQRQNNNNNNNNNNTHNNNNNTTTQSTQTTNPTSSSQSAGVSLSAGTMTWSVGTQGDFSTMIRNAYSTVNYRGSGQAWPTDGPGITFQPEGPGTYIMHWTCTEGLTCDQTIVITE